MKFQGHETHPWCQRSGEWLSWSGVKTGMRHEGSFWGFGNVLFLDLSVGYCFGFHTELL